jgi:cyclopropane fatty-acyl-phospholipid synthase-like methyltransferase
LDLGCGPGHFLLICRFFGHQGMGLDLPFPEGHLFNRLCRFFKIEKIDHRIEAYEPLTAVGRFDLITSSITQFNHDKATNKPWGIPEWQFFIAYMQHNHLMPDGKMYLTLTSGDRQDDVWRYLRAIAEPTGDSGLLIPC